MVFKISLAIMFAALAGCTYYPTCWFWCTDKDWYGLIQTEEKTKCFNEETQGAMDNCLGRLDKRSYEDYEIDRKRSEAKQ